MKKLTTVLLTLLLSLSITGTMFAKGAPAAGSWSGTLIDKHCGAQMAADPSGHEKACVMKCAKNGKGLGMIVDGKWYAFDNKGEKLAWKILKASKTNANVQVSVAGTMKGNKINVTKISEKG